MSYRRMTFVERTDIFKLLYFENLKRAQIGQRLNRSPSSITREINRGLDDGMYNPLIAEVYHLEQRKTQAPQLKMTSEAWNIVKPKPELRWSPEQIVKRLKAEYPQHTMSGKTIYNYVFFHMKGELKKLVLSDLRQRGKRRRTGKEDEKRGKIPEMTLIDSRPEEINNRSVYGNREGTQVGDMCAGRAGISNLMYWKSTTPPR